MTMSSRQISKFIWYILSYLWTIATFPRKYIIIEQNIGQPDLLPPFFSLSLVFFLFFFYFYFFSFSRKSDEATDEHMCWLTVCWWVILLLVFCVVYAFVCRRSVSCVPNASCVSWLSIPDCPFGFLWRLYVLYLCAQCFHCLWIVHSRLPLRFSLTFICLITNRR